VQLVIADTGPVNYLILIGHIDLLPRLFDKVILPAAVRDELMNIAAPREVQSWAADPPAWAEILETQGVTRGFVRLGAGEAAVIALAESLHADLLLIDERKGAKAARSQGFRVTGTLGLLEMAAQAGLVDFGQAAERLRRTTFRSPDALIQLMLKRHGKKSGDV
jgi:predicted nucleic acid-binding protein